MGKSQSDQITKKSSGGAFFIALGIFLSRITGLIRERALAHYLGNSDTADAFKAAFKIPNFLQNLFGEGALSASFIPVYSELLAQGKKEEAETVARTIFSFLLLAISLLVTVGVYATPLMINLIAPGFENSKKELTIRLVQILFPGTGLLVLSAWCLGILNSHRAFFISYVAPVVWNFTIIIAFMIFGVSRTEHDLVHIVTWSVVLGSFLQFLIQIPFVLKFLKFFPFTTDRNHQSVKTIIRSFGPALMSRGIVQISSYIDNIIASLLKSGAVSGIAYAQTISTLPISLFGMSISQAELTHFSHAVGSDEEKHRFLKTRLATAIKRLNFFIIPTMFIFIGLGDVVVSALFQSGQFDKNSTHAVWMILIGSTFGLLASTKGRLYSSCFYSLKDTVTPMYVAILRVFLTTVLGIIFSLKLPALLGISNDYAPAGLTLSFGLAGQIEYFILKNVLQKKIGKIQDGISHIAKMAIISSLSLLPSYLLKYTNIWELHPISRAVVVFTVFGLFFLFSSYIFKEEEVRNISKKLLKKI